MRFAVPAPAIPTIPVAGEDCVFPVRRIWCVGRNYADHAREMGHDPNREPPFFFAKPADAVVPAGGALPFPSLTHDLHHEIELVAVIGGAGENVPAEKALDLVWGYAVGLDMTRRDLQAEAKKLQRPWEIGKAFDRSAPVSPIVPAARIGHPDKGAIWLKVNGQIRQQGNLNQQIWSVAEAIAHLSRAVALAPGDLIMTGTPAGVAAVKEGDTLEGHIDGVGDLTVRYGAAIQPAA